MWRAPRFEDAPLAFCPPNVALPAGSNVLEIVRMPKLRALRRVLLLAALVAGAGAAFAPTSATAEQTSRALRPWLGVAMENEAQAGSVKVRHVVRGSPAEKAGIKAGDRLVKVDGTRVATPTEVSRLVAMHAVGEVTTIALVRDAKDQTVRVTLAPFPTSDEMIRMDHLGAFAPAWKGVSQVSGTVPSSIGALRGRVVLLDFWATWCKPCRFVAPKLGALQARYGAQGLSVIGIASEPREDVALFAQRTSMSYAIGVDAKGETASAHSIGSLPTLFVIDKRGVVRDIHVGYDPSRDAQLESLVKTLLTEPAPTD